MRVIHATLSRVKPGRQNDAVGMAVEAGKLLTRHGAETCRLFLAGPAGEASGTQVLVAEFPSSEAWGIWSDELEKDHETELLMERVSREDSPVVIESQGLGAQLLDRPTDKRGRIVEAYMSRVTPGRLEDAMGLANDVFEFVETNGAVNGQLMVQMLAGSQTDLLLATWELPDMRTLGRIGDLYMSDAKGLEIMARVTGADSPITTVSSGVYTEIPI